MSRNYNLNGLQTFTIGLIFLAASGFLSLLNLDTLMSAVFVGINGAALLIMAAGLASVKSYAGGFGKAFVILMIDGILTLFIVAIMAVDNSNNEIISQVDFYITVITKILDIVGVVLALKGCKTLLEQKSDKVARKYGQFQATYAIAMVAIVLAFACITIFLPGDFEVAVYGMAALALAAATFNFLAAMKTSKTISICERDDS